MATIRFAKVVSSLPNPLAPDTLYLVRVGSGFDLYMSDATGSIAYQVNIPGNVARIDAENTWYARQTFPGQGVWNTAGNVGIGTTNPLNRLVSVTNIGDAHASNLGLSAQGTAQGQRAGLSFYPTFEGTPDNTPRRAADILSGFGGGAWGNQYLSFNVGNEVNDSGNLTPERMRITAAGNVGVGTTAPTTRLHSDGPIRSTPATVATLPSASASGAGARTWVTDSTLAYADASIGTAVTGGGTNLAPVYSDGSTWRIG